MSRLSLEFNQLSVVRAYSRWPAIPFESAELHSETVTDSAAYRPPRAAHRHGSVHQAAEPLHEPEPCSKPEAVTLTVYSPDFNPVNS